MKVTFEISGQPVADILEGLDVNPAFTRNNSSMVASVLINKFNLDVKSPNNSCITYPNLYVGESLAIEYNVRDLYETENIFLKLKDKLTPGGNIFVYKKDITNFDRLRYSSMIMTTSRYLAKTMYDFE